jgi:PAS domain S-box-containing protein
MLLMAINVGIVLSLTAVFAALEPLGLASATVSRVAVAFPLIFIPLSGLCTWLATRGRLPAAIRLYVWANFCAVTLAVWLFAGIASPAWLLYIWTITIAGALLTPAHALRMTGGVVGYFVLLLALTRTGHYRPVFSFTPDSLVFLEVAVRMIMLVSTVGVLTFLNMRGLQKALTGLHQEVAERQRAEATLRRSEERFRALIEKSTDPIVVVDAGGLVSFWSPSATETLGWTSAEALGRRWSHEFHPDDRAMVAAAMERLAGLPGKTVAFTARQRRRDGTWRLMQVVARNLLVDPAVRGLVTNARDITDQRHLEEQVRQSQKMDALGRLASGVAHDFNNLLVAILGGSDCALEQLPADHPAAREVVEIRDAGNRAARLVRQLLTFSRRSAHQPVLTDLNAGALGLETFLRRTIGSHIDLEVVPAERPWRLCIDPTNLEQVVMNLALNARDSMPRGGRLRIEAYNVEVTGRPGEPAGVPPGRWACLAVQDTGTGMSAEVREHVFEPFFTTKPVGDGTGLGLSTVFGILEQAGGVILIESEPGHGTMFRLYLPATEPPVEAQAESLEDRSRSLALSSPPAP